MAALFAKIVEPVKKRYTSEWQTSDTTEKRELCWVKMNAFEDVLREIRSAIGTGQLAVAALAREERRKTTGS